MLTYFSIILLIGINMIFVGLFASASLYIEIGMVYYLFLVATILSFI